MKSKHKIYLLLNIGRDIRLLQQWLDFYSQWEFDGILIGVHVRPGWGEEVLNKTTQLAEKYNAVIADIHDEIDYALEVRRNRMIDKYCCASDWIVMADVDEFHQLSKSPQELVEICESNGYDFIAGRFLDRVGSTGDFPEHDENENIWDRFPVGVQLTRNIIGGTCSKVILARSSLDIPTGQHTAAGKACPYEEVNIVVHHFKWDASVFGRSRYMVWLYSMQGEPWFIEPLKFLKYAGSERKIDLADPVLVAYWPYLKRKNRSQYEKVNDCIDPLVFRPCRNKSVRLVNEDGERQLVNMENDKRVIIDDIGADVWRLCDGDDSLIQIISKLGPSKMQTGKSVVDTERVIQYFLRDISTAGFLNNADNYD